MLKRGVSEKSMGLLNMVIILLKHGVITPAFRMGLKLNNPSLQNEDGKVITPAFRLGDGNINNPSLQAGEGKVNS